MHHHKINIAPLFAIGSLSLLTFSTAPAPAFQSLLAQPDLYGYGILRDNEVAKASRKLMGEDYERFTQVLDVSSPAIIVDNRYVFGQGCQPHACDVTGAMIVVDTKTKTVWAAMTDGARKVAWPRPVARWPTEIRRIVRMSYK